MKWWRRTPKTYNESEGKDAESQPLTVRCRRPGQTRAKIRSRDCRKHQKQPIAPNMPPNGRNLQSRLVLDRGPPSSSRCRAWRANQHVMEQKPSVLAAAAAIVGLPAWFNAREILRLAARRSVVTGRRWSTAVMVLLRVPARKQLRKPNASRRFSQQQKEDPDDGSESPS